MRDLLYRRHTLMRSPRRDDNLHFDVHYVAPGVNIAALVAETHPLETAR